MDLDTDMQEGTPDPNQNDILDDVFGDEEDLALGSHPHDREPTQHHHQIQVQVQQQQQPHQHHHPSDIPRLQQEHTTAGYRDGITVAKATSIQSGFDEGFGLGATIGLRVGRLLGLLEGIAAAATTPSSSSTTTTISEGETDEASSSSSSAKDPLSLLSDAHAELAAKSIFSETFWNADGTWKYAVDESPSSPSPPTNHAADADADADAATGGGDDGDAAAAELLFSHVADAHPLVQKWTALVEGEMRRWGLREQVPLLERRRDGEGREEDESLLGARARARAQAPLLAVARRAKATGSSSSQGEAKAPSDALSW